MRRLHMVTVIGDNGGLIPRLSSGYDSPSMAQAFFKVLAPQEALKILLDVTPAGESCDCIRIQTLKMLGFHRYGKDVYCYAELR